MATPTSQKADQRPISFRLENAGQLIASVPLVIRPEDLSHNQPSLLSGTPTFGGAWIDDFGPGLASIQISGHTGWNIGAGWEESFSQLKSAVFTEWHSARARAVSEGKSPNEVKLIFADALNGITSVVAPTAFGLRRNKSRPLLMMYQIGLLVAADVADDIVNNGKQDFLTSKLGGEKQLIAGVSSLKDTISKVSTAAAKARSFIDSTIAAPVQSFMNLTSSAMTKVASLASSQLGLMNPEARQMISVVGDLSAAGRNAFHTLGTAVGLANQARFEIAGVASSYHNAFCLMRNAFKAPNLFPDLSGLYGSSGCSSTSGGSPLSPLRFGNPFETIIPPTALPPGVSSQARVALEALKVTDPALAPRSVASIGALLRDISEGVKL